MKHFLVLPLALVASTVFAQSPSPAPIGILTDLSGSHFQQTSFATAQFYACDLSKISFRSIDFSGTSIASANLQGVTIRDSNLSGVQIASSKVDGMKIDGILVTDLLKAYKSNNK